MNTSKRQSGFVMMVMVVIMVVGAVAYFSNYSENKAFQYNSEKDLQTFLDLRGIKAQLLQYAIFQPELYESRNPNNLEMVELKKIPAPGYLPCPDIDGDGRVLNNPGLDETSCGNARDINNNATGFVYGFLPVGFTTRNISFEGLAPKQYFYVVDERFVNGNNLYNNGETGRYAPLSFDLSPTIGPDASPADALTVGTDNFPWIRLNVEPAVDAAAANQNAITGYVALIIAPGAAQVMLDDTVQDRTQAGTAIQRIGDYLDKRFDNLEDKNELNGNSDGDRFFYGLGQDNLGVNDIVVGITLEEWQSAVSKRICEQENNLNNPDGVVNVLVDSDSHWFNSYDSVTNPSGSNWRTKITNPNLEVCP